MNSFTKHLIGIAERSVSTFVFTFYSATTFTSLSDTTSLKVGASAGALSVLKYLAFTAKAYLDSTGPTIIVQTSGTEKTPEVTAA